MFACNSGEYELKNSFEKSNFIFTEKVIEKKTLNENPQEFKVYKSSMKKKALMEKNKPGNILDKLYQDRY